jgi:hypothetical protein
MAYTPKPLQGKPKPKPKPIVVVKPEIQKDKKIDSNITN